MGLIAATLHALTQDSGWVDVGIGSKWIEVLQVQSLSEYLAYRCCATGPSVFSAGRKQVKRWPGPCTILKHALT